MKNLSLAKLQLQKIEKKRIGLGKEEICTMSIQIVSTWLIIILLVNTAIYGSSADTLTIYSFWMEMIL